MTGSASWCPDAPGGRGRRYSLRDIAKLRHIQHLSQDEGINLEGVRRIIALETELDGLHGQLTRLTQVVQELQLNPEGARLFTAEAGGSVHIGRARGRRPLALPPAPWAGDPE